MVALFQRKARRIEADRQLDEQRQAREISLADLSGRFEAAVTSLRGLNATIIERNGSLHFGNYGVIGALHGALEAKWEVGNYYEAIKTQQERLADAGAGRVNSSFGFANGGKPEDPKAVLQSQIYWIRRAAGDLFKHQLGRSESIMGGSGWLDREVLAPQSDHSPRERQFMRDFLNAYIQLDSARLGLFDGANSRRGSRYPSVKAGEKYFQACVEFYEKVEALTADVERTTRDLSAEDVERETQAGIVAPKTLTPGRPEATPDFL